MAEKPVLYEEVLRRHCSMSYGSTTPKLIDEYVVNSAKRIHSLMIWDASQNAFFRSATLPASISNTNAKYYIQYGATRRLEMIWYAYRNLVLTAPPDRSEPLKFEESRQIMIDLNIIYLNLRGVLDNFARALIWEFAPGQLASMRPAQVGLFLPGVKSNPIFATLTRAIGQHEQWESDVKERRDPAAHRIPLGLVPALLSSDEAARYRQLESEYQGAIEKHEFSTADQISDTQRKIGTFRPWFMHEPDQGAIEFYPIVPDDLAHTVQIFDAVNEFFTTSRS